MHRSPSSEADSSSASQEIPHILWNPEDSLPCFVQPISFYEFVLSLLDKRKLLKQIWCDFDRASSL